VRSCSTATAAAASSTGWHDRGPDAAAPLHVAGAATVTAPSDATPGTRLRRPSRRSNVATQRAARAPKRRPGASHTEAPEVVLYTDGACSGNPGPGGWAAIIIDGGEERIVSGSEPATTNQRMELTAAIEGLAAIESGRRVRLHTDSAYLVNCFRDRWWERWERTGWRGADGKPVTNRDLWERLLRESRRHDVTWVKVAGHSGNVLNDRADRLARAAITAGAARRLL
jgi:ribonuclease HI